MKKYLIILGLFIFPHGLLAVPPGPPYGTGVMTITNQVVPRVLNIGDTDGVLLDSTLNFSFDYTVESSYISTQASTDQTTWRGGTIYVTIDKIANNNLFDSLTCVPTNVAITSSYDSLNRQLTIVAPNTVSYSDIQSTLRTLRLKVLGQHTQTRTVRIWVETVGYKFLNIRNGRIFGKVEALIEFPLSGNLLTWVQAYADILKQPFRYGMKPYFCSISDASEQAALKSLGLSDGWIGGRSIPAASVSAGTVSVAFNYLSTTPLAPASDYYAWVGGPDKGLAYWFGGLANVGGGPVLGRYTNMHPAEPNGNGSTTASAAAFWSNSGDGYLWGDYRFDNEFLERYFLEYGGMLTDQNVITVVIPASNSILMGSPY